MIHVTHGKDLDKSRPTGGDHEETEKGVQSPLVGPKVPQHCQDVVEFHLDYGIKPDCLQEQGVTVASLGKNTSLISV